MNPVTLIEQQVSFFQQDEKKLCDKVDDFFLGSPWAQMKTGESEAALLKTSTNFVFPIVETATSVLVPPNPQVSVDEDALEEQADPGTLESAERYVNHILRLDKWRRELAFVIQSTVKYGRGVVKTAWDEALDRPTARYVDMRNYHFDRTAQRWDDVRYEFEATLLSRADVDRKIGSGLYEPSAFEGSTGDRYPNWMEPKGNSAINQQALKNFQPWFLVYEFYDREAGKAYHIFNGKVILEDKIAYRPYDLLTFNFNGRDVGGISEIGLILSNQEEYNWTETFLLNILRYGIPGIMYDTRALTDEQVKAMLHAPLGAAFGVKVPSQVATIRDAFAERPMVQPPAGAEEMLAKKRDGISYVSAMSDAMRAQTVGAKTATELAFLEGNTRNRLRPRQLQVDDITASIAEKYLLLAARYMKKSRTFKQPGGDWLSVDPWSLESVRAKFKMVPYSPMETNKAVKVETLRNLQSVLVGNPNVNQRKLTAKFLHLLDEDDLLLSEDELAKTMAAANPAPVTGPTPPAPGSMAPPVAEQASTLPPRAAAMSDAVAAPTAPPTQEPAP